MCNRIYAFRPIYFLHICDESREKSKSVSVYVHERNIVGLVRKWSLFVCDFRVWAQSAWFSCSPLVESQHVFPEVCVVR